MGLHDNWDKEYPHQREVLQKYNADRNTRSSQSRFVGLLMTVFILVIGGMMASVAFNNESTLVKPQVDVQRNH